MLDKRKLAGVITTVAISVLAVDAAFAGKVAAIGKPVRVTENGEQVTTRSVNCGGKSRRVLRKTESETAWCGVNVSSPCFSDVRLAARSACSSKILADAPDTKKAEQIAKEAEAKAAEAERVAALELERRNAYNKELAEIDSRREEIQVKLAEIENQKRLLQQQSSSN
ncbi:hypothetical protein NBRC116583_33980 [Arenicella sp. 4NH20-0111]|uniref:hypothetical protein n=1 Tax=Arenicella sp. 4NH20-0111 TaxID=3127648 RepID=UPI00310339FD